MAVEVIKANAARAQFRRIIDAVSSSQFDVVIERYDTPMVAVIPYQDYQALRDALDDLRLSREVRADYEAYLENPDEGVTLDEFLTGRDD